jgi:hypothetical protein
MHRNEYRGHGHAQVDTPVSKTTLIWIGLTLGSLGGGYLPALWGGDLISFTSVILSTLGGILGIWLAYRLGDW